MAYSLRAYEYWLTVYRRVWRGTVVSSVLNPVLYLTALGVGLGRLVNRGAHPLGIPYLDYVAPGHARGRRDAGCRDRVELSRARRDQVEPSVLRDACDAASCGRHRRRPSVLRRDARRRRCVDCISPPISAFGAVHSAWAIAGVPFAVLIGLAFAAPISALSAWADTEIFNPLFRFAITPLFLFSGTFFPITRLPRGLREIAYATPLWHGVAEFRDLTLGTPTLGRSALHVGYLLVWTAVGVWFARRAYAKALVT